MVLEASVARSLRGFPFELARRFESLLAAELTTRPAEGGFAFVEHLCHLRDYEREGCQHRVARMLAEESPALADFEGERLAQERDYLRQDAALALADFAGAREASLSRLEGLGEAQLARQGRVGSLGEVTIRRLAEVVAEHDAEHLREIDGLVAWMRGEADRKAIANAVEQFRLAYEAGDVAALASCYSDTLVKLRQGAPPESKAETVRRVGAVLRDHAGRLEVRNDEVLVSGDLAVIRGSFVATLTPKGGGEPKSSWRRFLEVWRRENGAWLVCRTMDNSEA